MKKIKILTIIFNKELSKKDIPSFRGAILNLLGEPDVIFHNHTDDEKFVYKYPKIQYKVIGKKATLYCLGEGVEKIYSLLSLQHKGVEINGEKDDLLIESVNAGETLIQAWDTYFNYRISSWLALNEKNYSAFRSIEKSEDKIYFLENILRGNILSLGKGLDCHFDKEVKVSISEIKKEYTSQYKGVKMHAIDLEFKSNVSLPAFIGLGKGVSIGFGVVTKKRNDINK